MSMLVGFIYKIVTTLVNNIFITDIQNAIENIVVIAITVIYLKEIMPLCY
jgi:hypothetical protein